MCKPLLGPYLCPQRYLQSTSASATAAINHHQQVIYLNTLPSPMLQASTLGNLSASRLASPSRRPQPWHCLPGWCSSEERCTLCRQQACLVSLPKRHTVDGSALHICPRNRCCRASNMGPGYAALLADALHVLSVRKGEVGGTRLMFVCSLGGWVW